MADYVVKYDIVCAKNPKELREKISEKMAQGWQPEGDIIKEEKKQGINCWHQKRNFSSSGQ